MTGFTVPLIIRGEVIDDFSAEHALRRGGETFRTADLANHIDRLVLARPSAMTELYDLKVADIIDFLDEVGKALRADRSGHMAEGYRIAAITSGLSDGVLRRAYERSADVFQRDMLYEMVENAVGVDYLDGWVTTSNSNGAGVAMRAFGARTVHIIAGNSPTIATMSIVRNALTRGDGIIKLPSNDPLTAVAILRTMAEVGPNHPVTRHVSAGYWKGGDAAVEDLLYQPRYIEKIVAWGGFASVSHIARYIQPGIDLITLDPKLSSTIIGRAAFATEASMREASMRAALDVGAMDQEGCVNARVIYIETGSDPDGIATANRFGEMLREEILALPPHISGPAKSFDPVLAEEIAALKFGVDFKVYGGDRTGGVIVSQLSEPVDFARLLAHRTANLVPVDDLEMPIRAVSAYTQTIGVYPEVLKLEIRDRLAIHGGQRVVSLGGALGAMAIRHGVQDGIEPMRRMCKWIVDERVEFAAG